ncbi:MAG: hypothetical protein NUV56_01925 [Candidatus Uhrbacteria bacterium]|nr:hypothetical protein [Candidatus Uhrbacteria bacterium]
MDLYNGRRVSWRGALITLAVGVFSLPLSAFAQLESASSVASEAGLSDANLLDVIGKVIGIALSLLGIVFLILIIYSGYIWMTAGGEGKQVDKAKQILINATVGIVITLGAYAISSFILNALTDDGSGDGSGSNGSVSVETLSGSLGNGAIRDHFPERNSVDVARNTRMYVTFNQAMNIESFATGYDTNGTAEDTSDDTVATAINSELVKIYVTGDGVSAALTNVQVAFTDDLKTFVFNPDDYLGSSSADTSYTVFLDDEIENADGDTVLNTGGYMWSFEVGTTIDLTAPTVESVTPVASSTVDRNITVQVTFSEAVDPTSSTGTRETSSGFSNIQTVASSDTAPIVGTYAVSNGYRTITFVSSDACGENSCGETVYCLPPSDTISVTVQAATTTVDPPQADAFPYDGIVDTSGNSLDGNGDGTAGDDYGDWSFTTTADINLDPPAIETVTPNLEEEDVSLDQDIQVTFDSILMSSSIDGNIVIDNEEATSHEAHELWFVVRTTSLTADDQEVVSTITQTPAKTRVELPHGTFLESVDDLTYLYGITVDEGLKNQYQNCFAPAAGPYTPAVTCDLDSPSTCCATTDDEPYCCNGTASASACVLF